MNNRELVVYYPIPLEEYRDTQKMVLDWSIPAYSFEEFLQKFHNEKHARIKAATISTPTINDCRDHALAIKIVFFSAPYITRYNRMSFYDLEARRVKLAQEIKEKTIRRGDVDYIPTDLLADYTNVMTACSAYIERWEQEVINEPREKKLQEKKEKEELLRKEKEEEEIRKVQEAVEYAAQQAKREEEQAKAKKIEEAKERQRRMQAKKPPMTQTPAEKDVIVQKLVAERQRELIDNIKEKAEAEAVKNMGFFTRVTRYFLFGKD